MKLNTEPFGFIMIRCMTDELNSGYWVESYKGIRSFYPDTPIVIIDDNSDIKYINKDFESSLYNCYIIESEYKKCGEILGYYYMYKYKLFNKAVIIHDSVFIKDRIDFYKYKNVKFIWHFNSKLYGNESLESSLLDKINQTHYSQLHLKHNTWYGCFGVMSVIDLNFLDKISEIFILLDYISCRLDRMCVERIFAVMCFYHCPELYHDPSIMGWIRFFPLGWGYSYHKYIKDIENKITFPPIVKIWSGR